MLTNSHPLALLKIKTKFKTNHTARILISEIFLNKLSIGQLAQLSLITSPGLSFCKDVGLLRLVASPSGVRASEAQFIHLPQTTLSLFIEPLARLVKTRSPRRSYQWPKQTSPSGFCCKSSQLGPPTSYTCKNKGENKKGDQWTL